MSERQLFRLTEKDWERATPEQQGWYTYSALTGLNQRLDELESKRWFRSSLAFVGGLIGGALATLGIKITS